MTTAHSAGLDAALDLLTATLRFGAPNLHVSHLHLHHARVGNMAEMLATALGHSSDEAAEIARAAALHDTGKIYLSAISSILDAPRALTPEERSLVEQHTHWGAAMLSRSNDPSLALAAQVALEHHERWNGSGYPFGLRDEAICPAARIVAVCDVYDALRDVRPYKPAMSHTQALAIITEPATAAGFEPRVLEAFYDHHRDCRDLFDMHGWPRDTIAERNAPRPRRSASGLAEPRA